VSVDNTLQAGVTPPKTARPGYQQDQAGMEPARSNDELADVMPDSEMGCTPLRA